MKSPAFQFYPDDFMGGKPGMMTPEQTHVYIWLLCLDWNQNGFPLDVPTLARWCHVTPAVFRKAWGLVQECFNSREGRWFNERLEKERIKQAEWREKSSKGGKAKRQPPANHPSNLVDEKKEPNGNTPVSVSCLHTPVSTETEREHTHTPAPAEDPEAATLEQLTLLALPHFGEVWGDVDAFLKTRRPRTRAAWLKEFLKITGPGSQFTVDDLSGACADATALDEPISGPHAIRAFTEKRKAERLAQDRPAAEGGQSPPGRRPVTAADKQDLILESAKRRLQATQPHD